MGAISNGSDTLSLTKSGTGKWVLAGVNSYTGNTTINASGGTLEIGGAGQLGSGSYGGTIAVGASSTFSYASSANQTLTNVVSGSGALSKSGASTLALTEANTYTGQTNVNAGTLVVSGSLSGTASVSVASGAALASGTTGSITTAAAGNVAITGSLAPGGSTPGAGAGTLNFSLGAGGKLNFASSSTLLFGLGTTSDVVAFNAAGDWLSGSANATLQLDVTLAGFSYANTYTVFNNVTTDGFTFANITGYDAVNYTANFADAGSSYQVNFVAVPEPGSAVSLLAGLGMLAALRRRRLS